MTNDSHDPLAGMSSTPAFLCVACLPACVRARVRACARACLLACLLVDALLARLCDGVRPARHSNSQACALSLGVYVCTHLKQVVFG